MNTLREFMVKLPIFHVYRIKRLPDGSVRKGQLINTLSHNILRYYIAYAFRKYDGVILEKMLQQLSVNSFSNQRCFIEQFNSSIISWLT